MEALFDLIRKTALPMPESWTEPYGAFHLLFFIVGVPAAVLLGILTSRRGDSGRRDMLTFAVGIALMLGEAYKQLFYPAVEGAWRADLFPFQLCSIPMYVAVSAPFIKNDRARMAAYTFLATYGLMGGAASYISPGTMLRPYLAMTLHSFLWHLTLIFLGVHAAASGRCGKRFSDAAVFYLCLCAAAFAINFTSHASHPEVNMFYLGPTPSELPICRDITAALGWQVNSILYMAALTLCAFLIHLSWRAVLSLAYRKGIYNSENK